MTYTTQGLMTPLDLTDRAELHDEHTHPRCPGHPSFSGETLHCLAVENCPDETPMAGGAPMSTHARMSLYQATNGHYRLTPKQRRRLVKKAGKDPDYVVIRDNGMGFAAPARQGMRELAYGLPVPVSGAPY